MKHPVIFTTNQDTSKTKNLDSCQSGVCH